MGFVEPIPCPEYAHCPAGATMMEIGSPAAWVIGFSILLIVFGMYWSVVYRRRELELSKILRDSYGHMNGHRVNGPQYVLGAAFKHDTPRVEVTFKDVGMVVKATEKVVLSGITGHFPAGSLVALMGPSGGGKTTFMVSVPWSLL